MGKDKIVRLRGDLFAERMILMIMMIKGDEFVVFRLGFFVVVFLQLCFVVDIRRRVIVGVKGDGIDDARVFFEMVVSQVHIVKSCCCCCCGRHGVLID